MGPRLGLGALVLAMGLVAAKHAGFPISWTWATAPLWLPIVGFVLFAAGCVVLAACAMGQKPRERSAGENLQSDSPGDGRAREAVRQPKA
ncbi:hypothetical protein [Bosea sp. NBC_00550]|uniref:hypothetical protein n=1 Tax=Bosea sp. NBC_00550 TaxID=2969621 RepID=UPI002232416B|nr:hypothetical protein [Bosea sp. NBC_00550]UZF94786.1 hypothetical protein NWE53_11710 [Bosea sp. NBC_00550]